MISSKRTHTTSKLVLLFLLLQCALVTGKLADVLSSSWLIVFTPTWLPLLFLGATYLVMMIIVSEE